MKQTTLDAFIRAGSAPSPDLSKDVKSILHSPSKNPPQGAALHLLKPSQHPMQLIVFTDGACTNNGYKNAKASYACVWPDHPEYNTGLPLPPFELQTNNRGEYRALLHALIQADVIDEHHEKQLVVYTDSKLMIDSFTKWVPGWKRKGWKKADGSPVANVDLLRLIDEKMHHRKVVFKHVRAHTGRQDWESVHNDMVDRLARGAIKTVPSL